MRGAENSQTVNTAVKSAVQQAVKLVSQSSRQATHRMPEFALWPKSNWFTFCKNSGRQKNSGMSSFTSCMLVCCVARRCCSACSWGLSEASVGPRPPEADVQLAPTLWNRRSGWSNLPLHSGEQSRAEESVEISTESCHAMPCNAEWTRCANIKHQTTLILADETFQNSNKPNSPSAHQHNSTTHAAPPAQAGPCH